MARKSKARKGWYGQKSRRYTKKEYYPDIQLKQADENWIIVNYNQARYRKTGNLVSPKILPGSYRDNRELSQVISHSYENCHFIFDQFEYLYSYLCKPTQKVLKIDRVFSELVSIFQRHIWWFPKPEFQVRGKKALIYDPHKNALYLEQVKPEFCKIFRKFSTTVPREDSADLEIAKPEFRSDSPRPFIYDGFTKKFYGSANGDYLRGTDTTRFLLPMRVEPGGQKTVLLAFSGGKNSLATALFYKEHGFDVRLFHLCGINRAYGDECEIARQQAERIDLPLYVQNVSVGDGYYEDYTIHPMRNIIIANAMIHFAFNHHLPPNIAFGTLEMDRLAYNCFDVCGGDCREIWDAYECIIRTLIPDFRVRTPLSSDEQVYERLRMNPSYRKMITSCATELQHRGICQRRVARFFDYMPEDNRCGVCWKCARDYIYECDHDLAVPNYHYYIICLTILKAQFDGEIGVASHSMQDIWHRFFFYNMRESKFYEELRAAKIRDTGNISFPNHVVEHYYAFNSFKRVSSIEYINK